MKRFGLILLLLFVSSATVWAQRPQYKRHDWEDNRKLDTLTAAEKREGGLIMLDKRIIETYFDETGNGKSEVVVYFTKHMIIRMNTDYAIESYNTVYIPMTNVLDLVEFKARFISKDGKVHEMDNRNVKDVENYDNNGPYKIYALEGIEIGGEVEYIYTVRRNFRVYGTENYRSSYNYRTIELDIYSPNHLKYDAKGYNGLPEVKTPDDYDNDDKRLLSMRAQNVEGYEDEMYSAQNASYPRVEYKFAYNTSVSRSTRLNTWDDAAETFHSVVYSYTPNEKRMADMLYKKMNINLMSGKQERIRKIESYVKSHFTIREGAEGANVETVGGIIQSQLASETGIIRLYAAIFEAASIPIEIVLTSDRFEKEFDGEFDSWTYLRYYLIYFPQTDNFIAPTDQFSRYGFIPMFLAHQDGLFIKQVELGGVRSGSGSVKHIDGTNWEQNMNRLSSQITFDLETGLAHVHAEHSYSGHAASFIQPYFTYMSAQSRRESGEGIVSGGAFDARPKNLHISGFDGDDTLYLQPFKVAADFKTNSYLEKTCDKFIFKVGEVIGSQVEMYQKETRRTDMVLGYPHGFYREISFTVPDGYRVTNLDAINMHITDSDSAGHTMIFHSYYKQEGSKVNVIVEESYRQTHYPIEFYSDFRKVINASADFNKVVVYFEKK